MEVASRIGRTQIVKLLQDVAAEEYTARGTGAAKASPEVTRTTAAPTRSRTLAAKVLPSASSGFSQELRLRAGYPSGKGLQKSSGNRAINSGSSLGKGTQKSSSCNKPISTQSPIPARTRSPTSTSNRGRATVGLEQKLVSKPAAKAVGKAASKPVTKASSKP
ncbi:unnamed protein product [Symbiodinium pilosum]|uniref:Uncharacterized protein n=1 Tax=Symbiodinium pilosum TaxID=2952 RepID=A0A812WUD6_SYMPI|nr:unnamed protein product [Symbiodinium pilosum]